MVDYHVAFIDVLEKLVYCLVFSLSKVQCNTTYKSLHIISVISLQIQKKMDSMVRVFRLHFFIFI